MKKSVPYLGALFIFLITLEVIMRVYIFWNHDERAGKLEYSPADSVANWRGLPFKIPVKDGNLLRLTKAGEVVFDLPFKINSNATRGGFVNQTKNKSNSIHFIGCSYTFGTGVRDDETLPSYIAKKMADVQTFNHGFSGSTPVEILLKFQKVLPEEIVGTKRTFIYTFIDDHVRRHALSLPYVGRWGKWKQVFKRKNETYEPIGVYKDLFPLKTAVYDFLTGSGIMYLLYPFRNPPLSIEEKKDLIHVYKLMERQSRLLGGDFLVLIWPGVVIKDWMIDGLREAGIAYLDLSQMDLYSHTKVPYIPVDLHPSPEGFAVVGNRLISYLQSRNQSK